LPTELRVTRQSIADTKAAQERLAEGLRENARIVSTGVNKVNGAIEAIVKTAETAKGEIAESVTLSDYNAEKARVYAEGGMMPSLGGVQLPAITMGAKGYWEKTKRLKEQVDGKVTEANQAKTDAVTAKTLAETAKGQAEGFAKDASTSASNASTSATNAKTSENNAKSYATQAENATALKVDKRINTADNSEYPLVVMIDKDVYKFVAPKGATNDARCRYCCDGTGHYFGHIGATENLYEYDVNLKFVRKIRVAFGQYFNADYERVLDFCTKIGDNYYIRSCDYPYTTEYIRKYDVNGTQLANCVIVRDTANTRICRNERTNHLLVFTKFTADTTMEEHTVHANKMGYTIYDENLNALGVRELDCEVPTTNGFNNYGNWLQHLNIVGNTTLISYAPTDTEKTAFYYLDANDDLVGLNLMNANTTAPKPIVIRGSGDFVASEKSSTGRTDGKYFVPRMFYDYRDNTASRPYHKIWLTNGAKWVDLLLYYSTERKGEIVAQWERFITTNNISSSRYDAHCVFFANGSGNAGGQASYVQNVANLSASGIVTKVYQVYGAVSFTDFAPDPFASLPSFPRVVTGNTHPAFDTTATPRAYQLYPAGTYGQAGGAIMFTV
jgi:hypothetical protein